jgi:cardiolipin synthase
VLERRHHAHRIERLRNLRYHHKLVFSILIVFGILAAVVALAKDTEVLQINSEYGAADRAFQAYLAALVGAQLTSGNTFDLLQNGDEFLPAMLTAIDNAKSRVDLESYIYEKGTVGTEFTNALENAARRGVAVNIVIDAVGSDRMSRDSWNRLRTAGATIGDYGTPTWYKLQQINYRTHRKVLVVDGHTAFTGGAGIADHWLGHAQDKDHWRDMMVRIHGPLVRILEGVFSENLVRTVKPVTPIVEPPDTQAMAASPERGTAFVVHSARNGGSNDLKRTYMVALAAARRSIDICSPYFLTDKSSRWALQQAVQRGVHVRLLVEGDQTDSRIVKYASRAKYDGFLQQGIEIYEYQPTMMHTKAMVIDGVWSMFGSANFDNRSLEMNDELNVAVADPDLAARLRNAFDADLRRAKRLDLDTWRRRGMLEKIREYFWTYFGEVF